MPTTIERAPLAFSPLHLFLLASMVPLFVGAALSDYAYASTYQVQWTNFSSWLIVGGLVFNGAALVCGLIGLLHARRRDSRFVIQFVLLLAAFVLGFINAFIHARDAWASMPTGWALSIVVAVLASATAAVGFSPERMGSTP
jgi:uncharacterized membrane protein